MFLFHLERSFVICLIDSNPHTIPIFKSIVFLELTLLMTFLYFNHSQIQFIHWCHPIPTLFPILLKLVLFLFIYLFFLHHHLWFFFSFFCLFLWLDSSMERYLSMVSSINSLTRPRSISISRARRRRRRREWGRKE